MLRRQKTSCYTFWLPGGLCMQDEHQFYLFDDSTVQDACSNDLRNHWCLKLPAVRANKWGSSLHHHRHHRWEAVHKWTCNIEQLRVTQEDDKRWRGGTKKRWCMMKNPRIQGNPSKKGRTGLIMGQINGWWWFLVQVCPQHRWRHQFEAKRGRPKDDINTKGCKRPQKMPTSILNSP